MRTGLLPVGNDIVDLREPGNHGKSLDGRFLARVFTGEEQTLILRSASPDRLLWALWAAKEAAYKAVSRSDPGVPSIPRLYPVVLDGENAFGTMDTMAGPVCDLKGRVATPRGDLALRIDATGEYVHALVAGREEDLARIVSSVDEITDAGDVPLDPSGFVRRHLLEEIARRLGCSIDALSVRKDPAGSGAPRVLLREQPLTAGISLSHDGRFTAFALDTTSLGW